MTREVIITIENKLVMEKRDMTVYHHSTRSAHMISCNSSIEIPLRPVIENDYLHISIVSGPGNMGNKSVVDLPSWVDFELSSAGDAAVAHKGDRVYIKIPPGPPKWQIKMTRTLSTLNDRPADHVTVGDDQLEHQ